MKEFFVALVLLAVISVAAYVFVIAPTLASVGL